MSYGRYYEDFTVGQEFRHWPGRTITEADCIWFALLTMNQEFNPNSAEIDFQLGDIYEKAGDKEKAIARYQAVLTKRPNDQRARQRLTQLGKPPA